MKKKINVTRKIIDRSVRRSPVACMVANAIREMIIPGVSVYVAEIETNQYQVELMKTEYSLCEIPLSRQVSKYISDFDQGWTPDPFYMIIDIPQQFLEM